MLQIRYSPPTEVDISGSPRELLNVKARAQEFLSSTRKNLLIEADTSFDPKPYKEIIPTLEFSKTNDSTKISLLSDTVLLVEGSVDNLEIFLSWFEFSLDAKAGMHGHFEWFDGNQYVNEKSLPVVVSVR